MPLFFNDPDIAVFHGIALVLQLDSSDLARVWPFLSRPDCIVGIRQFYIIMNQHAVMIHRDSWGFSQLAVLVESRCAICDIVALPLSRHKTHVDFGPSNLVDCPALIIITGQAVGI